MGVQLEKANPILCTYMIVIVVVENTMKPAYKTDGVISGLDTLK